MAHVLRVDGAREPDEEDDRGYNIVTFDDDVQLSRRGLDTREFVFVEVDLADGEGLERVNERVGEYDLTDAVVIVHVDGEGDPITPAGVEEYAHDHGALVARVTDHREFADEREVEVSFADPDEAVRERVRELGLSEAARDIDETIRASKVPDSNVADSVEDRVAELVDDGDLGVFDGADDGAATPTEADGGQAASGDDEGPIDGEQAASEDADGPADGVATEDPEDQSTMGEYL